MNAALIRGSQPIHNRTLNQIFIFLFCTDDTKYSQQRENISIKLGLYDFRSLDLRCIIIKSLTRAKFGNEATTETWLGEQLEICSSEMERTKACKI